MSNKLQLFANWWTFTNDAQGSKIFRQYTEGHGRRTTKKQQLATILLSHYEKLERIAEDLKRLGYAKTAELIKERLPQSVKSRSGDLGEILASELVEEHFDYQIPIRRLRFKDGREVSMRGDDFIGVKNEKGKLQLLKGESKSRKKLGKSPVSAARKVLNRDAGRCTPHSLLFIADRLLDSADASDNDLGRLLRDEVAKKTLPPDRIAHFLFTLSENDPSKILKEDLGHADSKRTQYSITMTIAEHQNFIAEIYEMALKHGNS